MIRRNFLKLCTCALSTFILMGFAPGRSALAKNSLEKELSDYLADSFGGLHEVNQIAYTLSRADLNLISFYPLEFKETISTIRRDYSSGNTIVMSAWVIAATEASLISYLISETKNQI